MDYFLDDSNVINRLVEEWRKYGQIIIAFDYDNTIFDYYQRGFTFDDVIELLRECKKFGAYLMVYTACDEEKFTDMITYMQKRDIPFDSINEVPSYIPFKGKKLYYNILLDDRAGLSSAYQCLKQALNIMKSLAGNSGNNGDIT